MGKRFKTKRYGSGQRGRPTPGRREPDRLMQITTYECPQRVWYVDSVRRLIVFNDRGQMPLDTTIASLGEEMERRQGWVHTSSPQAADWKRRRELDYENRCFQSMNRRDERRRAILADFDANGISVFEQALDRLKRRSGALMRTIRSIEGQGPGGEKDRLTASQCREWIETLTPIRDFQSACAQADGETIRLWMDARSKDLESVERAVVDALVHAIAGYEVRMTADVFSHGTSSVYAIKKTRSGNASPKERLTALSSIKGLFDTIPAPA